MISKIDEKKMIAQGYVKIYGTGATAYLPENSEHYTDAKMAEFLVSIGRASLTPIEGQPVKKTKANTK